MSNPSSHPQADADAAVAAPDDQVSMLDAAALGRLRDLDPSGDNRVMERVMRAFESSLSKLLAQAEAAQSLHDHAAIRHVAHTLKSSSASVGALELSRRCAEIEVHLREHHARRSGAACARPARRRRACAGGRARPCWPVERSHDALPTLSPTTRTRASRPCCWSTTTRSTCCSPARRCTNATSRSPKPAAANRRWNCWPTGRRTSSCSTR